MYNDSLFRVSFKCFIEDEKGRVLVVKEAGRGSWDLPGGGIDHGESVKASIARELREETAFNDDFTFDIITVDDPVKLLTRDIWQIKVIICVRPESVDFAVGAEADEIAFINPEELKTSNHEAERKIYAYKMLHGKKSYRHV